MINQSLRLNNRLMNVFRNTLVREIIFFTIKAKLNKKEHLFMGNRIKCGKNRGFQLKKVTICPGKTKKYNIYIKTV